MPRCSARRTLVGGEFVLDDAHLTRKSDILIELQSSLGLMDWNPTSATPDNETLRFAKPGRERRRFLFNIVRDLP